MFSADARNRALALLLASLFGAAFDARAASEPRFRKLSTEEGLGHDVVYAVIQDQSGFLWIGTEGGIDRYDGAADDALYAAKRTGRNRVEIAPRIARTPAANPVISSPGGNDA